MKSVLVDTSGFFAALNSADPDHAEAAAILRRAESERWLLLTHNYIVHETWAVVQSRLGCEAVEQWQRVLLPRCEIVWVDQDLHALAAARCRQARNRRLSLTDCVSIELMRRDNVREALAYDRHFTAAGLPRPAAS